MAGLSRRPLSSFNLSFLDIMFCGFGAVVLLVLIVSHNVSSSRQQQSAELQAQIVRQQAALDLARERLQNQHDDYAAIMAEINTLSRQQQELERVTRAGAGKTEDNGPAAERLTALEQEIRSLQQSRDQLAADQVATRQSGERARSFAGEGNRQYLTGLKLGGSRVLLLIDASASMLDRKIVDIIRRKVMDEATRRNAPKWQRALATVEWLLANLQPGSTLQVIVFGDHATVMNEPDHQWIAVTDQPQVDGLLGRLRKIAPDGGTDLQTPFSMIRTINPPPDNIILLTDGLPTRGASPPKAKTIDGPGRLRLLEQAIKLLPRKIPVNVILFPVEGDPLAASQFWKLAIDTGGSFMTPTRDWP